MARSLSPCVSAIAVSESGSVAEIHDMLFLKSLSLHIHTSRAIVLNKLPPYLNLLQVHLTSFVAESISNQRLCMLYNGFHHFFQTNNSNVFNAEER